MRRTSTVQYVLPLLFTNTGFHDVPIALLYVCLRE